jgi:hypothetical protein
MSSNSIRPSDWQIDDDDFRDYSEGEAEPVLRLPHDWPVAAICSFHTLVDTPAFPEHIELARPMRCPICQVEIRWAERRTAQTVVEFCELIRALQKETQRR